MKLISVVSRFRTVKLWKTFQQPHRVCSQGTLFGLYPSNFARKLACTTENNDKAVSSLDQKFATHQIILKLVEHTVFFNLRFATKYDNVAILHIRQIITCQLRERATKSILSKLTENDKTKTAQTQNKNSYSKLTIKVRELKAHSESIFNESMTSVDLSTMFSNWDICTEPNSSNFSAFWTVLYSF